MGKTAKTKSKVKVRRIIESRTDFFYYTFRNVLLVPIPLLVVSGLVLSHLSLHSSATVSDLEADSLTLTLSTSCTLSSSVEEAHNASLNGGQYEEGIGITKVNAYCNDNNGYSVYAIGNSGDTDGNTDLISNINDNYNIHTGIYDSSSITASSSSTWSMKLTAGVGSGINTTPPTINNNYSNYNVVPNIYTLVASRASKTDMTIDTSVTGSYFTTTYDIYASSLQPAGTYTGKVKYLMVHPQNNLTTVPDINTAFTISGKMKAYEDSNGSYYAMQDMNSDICSLVGTNGESTSAQLVDIRDNNIYWVTKLKDGHCWMTQNLDLDIGGVDTENLTSENTDISTTASGSGIYSNGYTEDNGVWTWSPASTATTSNVIVNYNNNTAPNWPSTNIKTPYSAEGGTTYFYTSNTEDSDIKFTTLKECTDAGHAAGECTHYHVGNYYNWTAAIASNDSTSISNDYTVASNSICPKGWRLPVAANNNGTVYEFGDLLHDYDIISTQTSTSYSANGFDDIRKTPLWLVRSGLIDNNRDLRFPGSTGFYRSSVNVNDNAAYSFNFSTSSLQPVHSSIPKNYGFSVRCLAR